MDLDGAGRTYDILAGILAKCDMSVIPLVLTALSVS